MCSTHSHVTHFLCPAPRATSKWNEHCEHIVCLGETKITIGKVGQEWYPGGDVILYVLLVYVDVKDKD